MTISAISIAKPYLVLVGDECDPVNAKTGFGLKDWAPDSCVGQLRFSPEAVDLGLRDLSISQAVEADARTLVIGVAPVGGALPATFHKTILDALTAGLDVASGLHQKLSNIAAFAAQAERCGRRLHDVRHSSISFPVGTGVRRSGKRLLTIGTDCALGKKYTALALAHGLRARGGKADFRATGQTGILIAGQGVALDAVVADFIAGAAEQLSPDNAPDHWDIIEGQGSLFHPAYAGVTLGLVHGSQPDAMVLCHDPTRERIHGVPHMRLPPLGAVIEAYVTAARVTNPRTRVIGIALNTSALDEAAAQSMLRTTSNAFDLPCVDPVRTGVEPLIEAIEAMS